MPQPLQRPKQPAEQIHDRLAAAIAAGDYGDGAALPSVRDLVGQYRVARTTANRALAWLASDGVAEKTSRGYVARPGRTVLGPQQRMTRFPAAGRVEVLAAGLVDAPGYVRPLLGLEPVRMDGLTPVIRREQVHYNRVGDPFMLTVEWYPPQLGMPVPELLQTAPVEPGAVALIEERTGRRVIRGRQAREARRIRNDGREGPYLALPRDAHVLAEVWMLFDTDAALVYGEYVLLEGLVTENEWAA